MGCAGEAPGLIVRTTPEGWQGYFDGGEVGLYGKRLRAKEELVAAMRVNGEGRLCRLRWSAPLGQVGPESQVRRALVDGKAAPQGRSSASTGQSPGRGGTPEDLSP